MHVSCLDLILPLHVTLLHVWTLSRGMIWNKVDIPFQLSSFLVRLVRLHRLEDGSDRHDGLGSPTRHLFGEVGFVQDVVDDSANNLIISVTLGILRLWPSCLLPSGAGREFALLH